MFSLSVSGFSCQKKKTTSSRTPKEWQNLKKRGDQLKGLGGPVGA